MQEGVQGNALADPADATSLAARMEALLDDATRTRMGEEALTLAMQHSFENQADEFIALYKEIAAGK